LDEIKKNRKFKSLIAKFDIENKTLVKNVDRNFVHQKSFIEKKIAIDNDDLNFKIEKIYNLFRKMVFLFFLIFIVFLFNKLRF
jgi:hypothetical protein